MRIAILVSGLPPLCNGGTEIATVSIAKCASGSHEVHVIAGATKHVKCEIGGVTVHTIKSVNVPYLFGLLYLPRAVRAILRVRPDIIHAQGTQMALTAFVASKMARIPYIVYGRGEIYVNWIGKGLISRLLFNNASRVIAQTTDMANEMSKYTHKPVEVVPNGIDTSRFGVLSRSKARRKLSLPAEGKAVIAVGRCRPEKNLRVFVEAAKMDNRNTYILVGDGPEANHLRRQADGRVVFCGHVSNTDIPTYLSAADVLVNTSLSEGFPVAILEAMASGLPVVAPRVCGIPEIVEDWVNGTLTVPNSAASTSKAIKLILSDSNWSKVMAENNKRKAGQYTWENVVRKLYGQMSN